MFIILVKVITSVVLGLWLLLLLSKRLIVSDFLQQHRQKPWIFIFFVLLRLLPVICIYFLMGYEPTSDVKCFYPIALSAYEFKMPYLDVYTCYSPLFGYWLSLPLYVWNDIRVIILFMIFIEWLAVLLTYRLYKVTESPGQRLFRVLFYFSLPVPFVMSVYSGQEDILLWLFALLAIWVWEARKSPFLGGILLALGFVSTKAVFIFLLVPIFLMTPHRQKLPLVAGLAVLGLPVMGYVLWEAGMTFVAQQIHEGDYLKAPNWRSVFNPLLGGLMPDDGGVWKWITMSITLGILVITGLRAYGKRMLDMLPLIFFVAFGCMTVLQQNSISVYAYLFMLPLVFSVTDSYIRSTTLLLIAFNILAAIHPSFWWRIGQPYYDGLGMFSRWEYALEYGMEIALVAGFVYYAWQGFRQIDGISLTSEGSVRHRLFKSRFFGVK
jgi:hypothetical protein